MKTRIYVTPADIKGGCRENSENCPVARAVNRRMGSGYAACIGVDEVRIHKMRPNTLKPSVFPTGNAHPFTNGNLIDPNPILAITLPSIARSFIRNFDYNQNTLPRFNFRLDIPAEMLA